MKLKLPWTGSQITMHLGIKISAKEGTTKEVRGLLWERREGTLPSFLKIIITLGKKNVNST